MKTAFYINICKRKFLCTKQLEKEGMSSASKDITKRFYMVIINLYKGDFDNV